MAVFTLMPQVSDFLQCQLCVCVSVCLSAFTQLQADSSAHALSGMDVSLGARRSKHEAITHLHPVRMLMCRALQPLHPYVFIARIEAAKMTLLSLLVAQDLFLPPVTVKFRIRCLERGTC